MPTDIPPPPQRHSSSAAATATAVGVTSGISAGIAGMSGGRRPVRHRKVSDQSSVQVSPRRKESIARRDRIYHMDEADAPQPRSKATCAGGKSPAQSQSSDGKDTVSGNGANGAGAHSAAGRGRAAAAAADATKTPVFKYCKNHVRKLFHFPLAALCKGAAILSEDLFVEAIPAAWEMLLEADQELAANAAALFIIASVRAPTFASDVMQRALKHRDENVRIGAILRYQVLWKCRFQVWPRMEESAHNTFKVPPPGIEFTLPSPKIGIESLPVVDPPWTPRTKTKDMEVTLNQERHVSV